MYTACYSGTSFKPNPMETDGSGNQSNNVKIFSTLAILLRDLLLPDASFDCNSWPDEEIVKYSIER